MCEKFCLFFISRSDEEDYLDYEEGGLRLEAVAFSAQTAPKIAGGGPPPFPTGGIVVQAAALTPFLLIIISYYTFSLLDAIYAHFDGVGYLLFHSINSFKSHRC